MPVVRYLSTRIAVSYRGKIVEIGTTEQITRQPQHDYTRQLLAATPEQLQHRLATCYALRRPRRFFRLVFGFLWG